MFCDPLSDPSFHVAISVVRLLFLREEVEPGKALARNSSQKTALVVWLSAIRPQCQSPLDHKNQIDAILSS